MLLVILYGAILASLRRRVLREQTCDRYKIARWLTEYSSPQIFLLISTIAFLYRDRNNSRPYQRRRVICQRTCHCKIADSPQVLPHKFYLRLFRPLLYQDVCTIQKSKTYTRAIFKFFVQTS